MTKAIYEYNFLDAKIDPLTISDLNNLISESVIRGKKQVIANHNMNSLYIYHHNPQMRAFYQKADYIHIDGMALVILGQLLGLPLQKKHRVTYADWVWPLMAEAVDRGWRVFYLGSKPGIADRGASILQEKFPGLQIATHNGYFDSRANSRENQEVLAKIKEYQPNILMVGMGMPRQERWILENLESISANTILPSGACIDYVAGAIPTPPRWMGRVGLEWFYRLISEPTRLWRRYLIEPWFLLKLFCKQFWVKIFG